MKCIHHDDLDGKCAAAIIKHFHPDCEMISMDYEKDFPFDIIQPMEKIWIIDFTLQKPGEFKKLCDIAGKENVVWIDHHEINKKDIPKFVNYYNPLFNKSKNNEPVTALCYQITNKKEDLWLAIAGCISDHFIPDFYSEFLKTYLDLGFKTDKPFGILYNSQIGKIARIFAFALNDRTTNVIHMLKFLMKVKTPYEVLDENPKNKIMHNRFNEIDKRYRKLVEKAKAQVSEEKILFFQYSSDLSISANLSNQLSYLFPDKVIVVMRVLDMKVSISVRGKNIRGKVLKAIEGLENATGGGHENAVGARVKVEDLEIFREKLEKLFE